MTSACNDHSALEALAKMHYINLHRTLQHIKGKGSPYSITECRVPELIPMLGSQPAGDVNHKPGCRLPLLSTRPAVTPTLKRAATNFAAWWTEARWVWAVCLRLLPDSVTTAIWTQALLRLSVSTLTTQLPSHTLHYLGQSGTVVEL